jgi:hypothetical protein
LRAAWPAGVAGASGAGVGVALAAGSGLGLGRLAASGAFEAPVRTWAVPATWQADASEAIITANTNEEAAWRFIGGPPGVSVASEEGSRPSRDPCAGMNGV